MAYISNYLLVASGNMKTPVLNIDTIHAPIARTVEYCERIVAALAPAGYHAFTLYDVSKEIHTTIATFTVEQIAPVVQTRMKVR